MLNRFFAQDFKAAERWADQYTGDTSIGVYLVEVWKSPEPDSLGELYVWDAEALHEAARDGVDYEIQYDTFGAVVEAS